MDTMKNPLFILGAGFNKDANITAGPVMGVSIYGYPLADDLSRVCFGRELSQGTSIEECFDAALKSKNYEPIQRFYDILMEADNYLIPKLLPTGDNPDNCYARFFDRFKESSFLTFNYDSLAELFLLNIGHWYPNDGYGIPVKVALYSELPTCKSSSFVLHLHGSLCIYTNEFYISKRGGTSLQELTLKKNPDYIFDPESIEDLFFPYKGTPLSVAGHTPLEHRVIAPIPDKTEGLGQEFIKIIYGRAQQLISETRKLIVIGYEFSPYDRKSYLPLIDKLATQTMAQAILVGPNAIDIEKRLRSDFPQINWQPIPMTFKSWVDNDFPEWI